MYKTRRKLLSQNFLRSRELVSKLIRGSSISQNDTVLEIGAGKGIITKQLLRVCKKLIAIEADQRLFLFLKRRIGDFPNVSLHLNDFLKYSLPPSEPFKIFSNIPFSITGEIIKKLLFSQNPPVDSYLIVQREAAEKYIAKEGKNAMLAILFYPWFNVKIIHKFQRFDFEPTPRVDSCLVQMEKRVSPLVDSSLLFLYRDFVVYYFTRNRLATSLSPSGWLISFGEFVDKNEPRMRSKMRGSFDKWLNEERNLSKIHRTRIKTWKRW